MDCKQKDRFVKKFGWIRCFRCIASFSNNQQMMVLTCRHTFCSRCFQKVCQVLDAGKRMALCAECNKQAKFAQFNANLPAKFLKPFEVIGDSDMMRAARFQQQQWTWNLSNMSKKLQRKKETMKQKKARLDQQKEANAKLKAKHDEMYAELLESYSRDELERLLSYPLDDLKTMDVTPASDSLTLSSSPSRFFRLASVRHTINENSPTSLYRQVLLKNASSTSSYNTRSTMFPNDIPIADRPRDQPMLNQYEQQQRERAQPHASQRPGVYDGHIGYGTQGGYQANAATRTGFYAPLDKCFDFENL